MKPKLHKHMYGQTIVQTGRQTATDSQKSRLPHRQADCHTDRQNGRLPYRQTERQTDRKSSRPPYRQPCRQSDVRRQNPVRVIFTLISALIAYTPPGRLLLVDSQSNLFVWNVSINMITESCTLRGRRRSCAGKMGPISESVLDP